MRKIIPFLFFTFYFSVFGVALGVSQITNNLYVGASNVEVTSLQKFLNTSPDTSVSSSGPGSINNETEYFGTKTKDAVIRFQNKYASEVLVPVGLTAGTGYVGPLTRNKINSLLNSTTSSVATTTTTSSSTKDKLMAVLVPALTKAFGTGTSTTLFGNQKPKPVITRITPEVLDDGDVLTIYGSGFTDSNTVLLSIELPNKYQNIKSSRDGTVITLNINTMVGEKLIGSLRKSFANIPSDIRGVAMEQVLRGIRKDNGQVESGARTILVPTNIIIENENGRSNATSTTINIFKEL